MSGGGAKIQEIARVRVLLTSALADPEAEAEEARRRARGGAAVAARQ